MFENDRLAARGLMSARRLIIFEHSSHRVTLDDVEVKEFKTVVSVA